MSTNSYFLAKILAKAVGLPTKFVIYKYLNKGFKYVDKDNKLFFDAGTTGMIAISANTEKFMTIQTYETYTGQYGPAPKYNILEPEKFNHGIKLWVNPTAGSTAPHFFNAYTGKRGVLLPQLDLVKNVEEYVRYTDAGYNLTADQLYNAVVDLRYGKRY